MNVLAIGAHPDDVEFMCAGTLAKYAKQGDNVSIAVATNGNVGSPTWTREQTAAVRHEEALAAAAVIGAKLIWMGIDDEFLFSTRETRLMFIEAIRQADPDVMFVPSPNDYHPDHRAAGQIAIDARIPANVRLVETQTKPTSRIPHIFIMDTMGGVGFDPECYVDITDTFDIKATMLSKHASQADWLKHINNMDYVEFMAVMARQRGRVIGSAYAEAFQNLMTYPITGGPHLLPR